MELEIYKIWSERRDLLLETSADPRRSFRLRQRAHGLALIMQTRTFKVLKYLYDNRLRYPKDRIREYPDLEYCGGGTMPPPRSFNCDGSPYCETGERVFNKRRSKSWVFVDPATGKVFTF